MRVRSKASRRRRSSQSIVSFVGAREPWHIRSLGCQQQTALQKVSDARVQTEQPRHGKRKRSHIRRFLLDSHNLMRFRVGFERGYGFCFRPGLQLLHEHRCMPVPTAC